MAASGVRGGCWFSGGLPPATLCRKTTLLCLLPLLSPAPFPFHFLRLRGAHGEGAAEYHLAWAGPALREEGGCSLWAGPWVPDSVTSLHMLQTNKTLTRVICEAPRVEGNRYRTLSSAAGVCAGIRVGGAFRSPLPQRDDPGHSHQGGRPGGGVRGGKEVLQEDRGEDMCACVFPFPVP